ncbi:MAG: hypothetical protein COV76_02290 [Candidatus Omnitrophica bacterium CG11_big_fil_rev_8_21_14_0_20_64_10]|nr:MAG: hypothetical protein COV76_02290 [Candidatus Omnitrophica bacterium CG11_big_fil_rev_8_21_14_0_20_64_10]
MNRTAESKPDLYPGIGYFGGLGVVFGLMLIGPHLIQMGMAALWVAAGLGVILKRRWGRRLFITVSALNAGWVIADIFSGATAAVIQDIASVDSAWQAPWILIAFLLLRTALLAVCLGGIAYFLKPKVKAAFR